jgi:hypothetical protein
MIIIGEHSMEKSGKRRYNWRKRKRKRGRRRRGRRQERL